MEAVIIGSGIGGLTTGAFLAKQGIRVTVLEKHFQLGGYAHNFSRKGFTWEAAVHTVPFSDDGVVRSILTQLGVNDMIETIEHPEMYRVSSPDGDFVIPSRKDDIHAWFYETFPDEKENLNQFFIDMDEIYENMFTLFEPGKRGYHDKDQDFAMKFQGRSFQSYLDETFTCDSIKNVIAGQWPFVAITADKGARLFMSMLFATHYFNGSHSIKGGFSRLAEALASVITSAGGDVLLREEVVSISCEDKSAKSVSTKSGKVFDADIVVSNVSPQLLHNTLIEESGRSKRWIRRLTTLDPSLSSVIVYLGMKEGYESLIRGNVICHFDNPNSESIYAYTNAGEEYKEDYLVILNPTEAIKKPILTLLTFAKQDSAENWKEKKVELSKKILHKFESLYPGISDYIEYVEVGSPDTFVRYTDNFKGAIYGFENTCDKLKEGKMPYKAHLKNVYQAGHWTVPGCGIYNVVTNGFTVAQQIIDELSLE